MQTRFFAIFREETFSPRSTRVTEIYESAAILPLPLFVSLSLFLSLIKWERTRTMNGWADLNGISSTNARETAGKREDSESSRTEFSVILNSQLRRSSFSRFASLQLLRVFGQALRRPSRSDPRHFRERYTLEYSLLSLLIPSPFHSLLKIGDP